MVLLESELHLMYTDIVDSGKMLVDVSQAKMTKDINRRAVLMCTGRHVCNLKMLLQEMMDITSKLAHVIRTMYETTKTE